MNEKIVELIKELNCIVYEYDMNNLIYRNSSFINNEILMYKELITITSRLELLEIKFNIDEYNNILLSI